jgi:hypothetical protein
MAKALMSRTAAGDVRRGPLGPRRKALLRLTGRQVNLALAVAVTIAVATGGLSWLVGTPSGRWLTAAHAIAGVSVVVLIPAKLRGPVKTGFKRGRQSRYLSAAFGLLILVTLGLGIAHSTGLWYGVGEWSALWTHTLLAFVALPLLVWHITSRPVRPRPADLDRRAFLGGGVALGVAAAAVIGVETGVGALGLAGDRRRFTGSHEVGSYEPAKMPAVSWIDDRAPADTDAEAWSLAVNGHPVTIAELAALAQPVEATVDCTGGWYSRQSWDAVPLAALIPDAAGRSVRVTSATGYARRFAAGELDSVYLAVGYGSEPLRRSHGAPVRLIAPQRRGPDWVKWVTSVDEDSLPAWWQSPFPLT